MHKPTQAEFNHHTLARRRPVILRGGMDRWKAFSRWTPDYLASRAGDLRVPAWTVRDRICTAMEDPNGHILFAQYVRQFGRPETAAPTHYVGLIPIDTMLPKLIEDIEIPSHLLLSPLSSARTEYEVYFWMNLSSYRMMLHYDFYDNLLGQVQGRKRIALFAPDQRRFLYPHSILSLRQTFSRVDTVQWDHARFPKADRAEGIECTLEPGDMVFIPSGWWHQVFGLEPSISVNIWWPPPPSVQLHRHCLYDYVLQMRLLAGRSARTILRTVLQQPAANRSFERTRHAEGGTPYGSGTAR